LSRTPAQLVGSLFERSARTGDHPRKQSVTPRRAVNRRAGWGDDRPSRQCA
jgi:hypothetical protein